MVTMPGDEPVTSASLSDSFKSIRNLRTAYISWFCCLSGKWHERGRKRTRIRGLMALGGPPLHLQAGNPVELLLICLRQHAGLHKFRELLAIARQRVVLRHGEACAPDERGSEKPQGQERDRKR